jgi:RNA polymerase sigma-70 factor (ECF subfamily)
MLTGRALTFARYAQVILPALINGAIGTVNAAHGRPITFMTFTITGDRIVAIDLIDDADRIAEADLAILKY